MAWQSQAHPDLPEARGSVVFPQAGISVTTKDPASIVSEHIENINFIWLRFIPCFLSRGLKDLDA